MTDAIGSAVTDDESARDDAIDAFFEAMDAENPDVVRPSLADGFVYDSLSGEFEGVAGLDEYLSNVRSISDVAHETTRRVHDGGASVVEGVATGRKDGEPFEARFCNVFEFRFEGDESGIDDARIGRVTVYLNRS